MKVWVVMRGRHHEGGIVEGVFTKWGAATNFALSLDGDREVDGTWTEVPWAFPWVPGAKTSADRTCWSWGIWWIAVSEYEVQEA